MMLTQLISVECILKRVNVKYILYHYNEYFTLFKHIHLINTLNNDYVSVHRSLIVHRLNSVKV